MTKSKKHSLLARAAEEVKLLHEIWLIAVADAFRRSLMHQVTGLNSSDVIDWYFQEHQHMKRFVDRHIEAGTCAEGIAELHSEREKNRPSPRPALPRNPDLNWMQPTQLYPEESSTGSSKTQDSIATNIKDYLCRPLSVFHPRGSARGQVRTTMEAVPSEKPSPKPEALSAWMKSRVSTWPDDKSPPTEIEDLRLAREHFAIGFSREEFRLVREKATPAAWRKQGPRKPWGTTKP